MLTWGVADLGDHSRCAVHAVVQLLQRLAMDLCGLGQSC